MALAEITQLTADPRLHDRSDGKRCQLTGKTTIGEQITDRRKRADSLMHTAATLQASAFQLYAEVAVLEQSR